MQPSDSFSLFPDQSIRDASIPPFQMIRATEHGLVLESQKDFEIGSTVAIGFHVDNPRNISKSKFVSMEAMVVGSKPVAKSRYQSVSQITLLFSEIEREDRNFLLEVSSGESEFATQQAEGIGSLN